VQYKNCQYIVYGCINDSFVRSSCKWSA